MALSCGDALPRPRPTAEKRIRPATRIGIGYASKRDQKLKWRFVLRGKAECLKMIASRDGVLL